MKIQAVKTSYDQNNVYKAQKTKYNMSFGNSFCSSVSSVDFLSEMFNLVKKYVQSLQKESLVKNPAPLLKTDEIGEELLKKIASVELRKMLSKPSERIMYIITGRSGSGKSTIVRNLRLDKDFYVPDADNVKRLLPGYKEKGLNYVHRASYAINRTNLSEALSRGTNCVIQTTTTFENMDEMISEAKRNGYSDIKIVHVDVKEDIAIERCKKRAEKKGLKTNTDYIKQRKYIDDIVETYKNPEKGVNEIIVFDNNSTFPELKKVIVVKYWV